MDRQARAREKYAESVKLIADGSSIENAVKETGLSLGAYYKYKKEQKKTAPKKAHVFLDLERPLNVPIAESLTVAVVVCRPGQLAEVLRGLQ